MTCLILCSCTTGHASTFDWISSTWWGLLKNSDDSQHYGWKSDYYFRINKNYPDILYKGVTGDKKLALQAQPRNKTVIIFSKKFPSTPKPERAQHVQNWVVMISMKWLKSSDFNQSKFSWLKSRWLFSLKLIVFLFYWTEYCIYLQNVGVYIIAFTGM